MAAGTPWVLRGAPRVLSGNSEIFQNLDELDKHSQIMSNYVELCRTLSNCRISSNSSNFVELCRTLSNFVVWSNFVELVELCRTLSNFVESGCGGGPLHLPQPVQAKNIFATSVFL